MTLTNGAQEGMAHRPENPGAALCRRQRAFFPAQPKRLFHTFRSVNRAHGVQVVEPDAAEQKTKPEFPFRGRKTK